MNFVFRPTQLALCLVVWLLMTNSASADDSSAFPSLLPHIKRGIGFVEVPTNLAPIIHGTGFLIDSTGVLATCRHVIIDTVETKWAIADAKSGTIIERDTFAVTDTSRILIRMPGHDNSFRAHLIAERQDRDVALLQLDITSDSSRVFNNVLRMGRTHQLKEGLEMGCTGFDLAQTVADSSGITRYIRTTHKGIVSSVIEGGPLTSTFMDRFQLDMLVNSGASGGPVYRATDGVVLGIVQSVKSQRVGEESIPLGIANCQPMWVIVRLFEDFFGRKPSAVRE